jgi:hypothetical protein
MASNVECVRFDKFAIAKSFGPLVPIDPEHMRPLHGLGDNGRRAVW